jgi:hypothetical protein
LRRDAGRAIIVAYLPFNAFLPHVGSVDFAEKFPALTKNIGRTKNFRSQKIVRDYRE